MSPLLPKASNCLEKTYLNPKSLPIAVKADVSVANDMADIALRFFLYLTVNSVAKCCASDALPPFPKKIIFFLYFIVLCACSHNLKKIVKFFEFNLSKIFLTPFFSFSNIFLILVILFSFII